MTPSRSETARDRLVASGRLAPATGPFRLPKRRVMPSDEETASETLGALRDERLP
jgi:hypothetical protein